MKTETPVSAWASAIVFLAAIFILATMVIADDPEPSNAPETIPATAFSDYRVKSPGGTVACQDVADLDRLQAMVSHGDNQAAGKLMKILVVRGVCRVILPGDSLMILGSTWTHAQVHVVGEPEAWWVVSGTIEGAR